MNTYYRFIYSQRNSDGSAAIDLEVSFARPITLNQAVEQLQARAARGGAELTYVAAVTVGDTWELGDRVVPEDPAPVERGYF